MTIDNLFAVATRRKYRFPATGNTGGTLNVEDVWDLNLKAKREGAASLDELAQKLDDEVQKLPRRSFVDDNATESSDTDARNKLEIVLHIIQVKKAEAKANETAAVRAGEAAKLDALIQRKENQELENLDITELQKRRAALTAQQ